MSRKKRIILISTLSAVAILVIALVVGISIYLGTYYHADLGAVYSFLDEAQIDTERIDKEKLAFVPKEISAGFIFYPGGKVEAEAYHPLMQECAKKGILSVIVEMPFNLAVFDINGADGIREHFPEVQKWYIGGHSLGGSMAASYLDKHRDEYDGLILLGSYSTVDFSDSKIKVISIYGENDQVLNKEKYEKNKSNLPADFKEQIITGGNHAGFGMYGEQKGDGEATISNREQIKKTASMILVFIAFL